MLEKQFDEKKFLELLKNPSTLNSETLALNVKGVIPRKEKE